MHVVLFFDLMLCDGPEVLLYYNVCYQSESESLALGALLHHRPDAFYLSAGY